MLLYNFNMSITSNAFYTSGYLLHYFEQKPMLPLAGDMDKLFGIYACKYIKIPNRYANCLSSIKFVCLLESRGSNTLVVESMSLEHTKRYISTSKRGMAEIL